MVIFIECFEKGGRMGDYFTGNGIGIIASIKQL